VWPFISVVDTYIPHVAFPDKNKLMFCSRIITMFTVLLMCVLLPKMIYVYICSSGNKYDVPFSSVLFYENILLWLIIIWFLSSCVITWELESTANTVIKTCPYRMSGGYFLTILRLSFDFIFLCYISRPLISDKCGPTSVFLSGLSYLLKGFPWSAQCQYPFQR